MRNAGGDPVERLGENFGSHFAILYRDRDLLGGHLQVDVGLSYVKFDRTFFIGIFRLALTQSGIGLFNIRFHAAALKNRDGDSGCGLKNRSTLVRVDSLDTVIAVDAKGRKIL